jgi:phospholipid/cholesterol/gamma-HCH transport system substrate-binding protein
MRRRPLAVAGLVIGALVLSGCGVSLQSLPQLGGPSGPAYTVHATFADVLNLAPEAIVREGDATVGAVTGITAHDYQAHVTMKIRRGIRLPADTTAEVRFDTPLGDEFVELTVPRARTDAFLAPGATIPVGHTSAAASVEDTLAAVGTLLYGGGLGQAQTLTSELNQILGGNQTQIRSLLANLNTVVGSLADHDSDVDQALVALSNLSAQLNAGSGVIVTALDSLPAAAATLSADNGDVEQLLAGIDQLTPVALGVINQSGRDLVADTTALVPVVNQLVSVEGRLGSDLTSIQRFEALTARLTPGGYLQINTTLTGDEPATLPVEAAPLAPLLEGLGIPAVDSLLGSALSTVTAPTSGSSTGGSSTGTAAGSGSSSVTQLLSGGLP